MVERLILRRAYLGRDRRIPFVGIGEDRVDVEYDAAERVKAVTHDLPHLEFRYGDASHAGNFARRGAAGKWISPGICNSAGNAALAAQLPPDSPAA
jgi:hypothetical protein